MPKKRNLDQIIKSLSERLAKLRTERSKIVKRAKARAKRG